MKFLLRLGLLAWLILPLRAQSPARPAAIPVAGIENFHQVTARIYSGGSPEGAAAFAELQQRGIKTIISVDGSKPEVELAQKFGLRYVHLPVGYDGVPTNQAVRLVKAVESLPSPVFVHCHHGLHRGPAGVGVICMGVEGWTPERAVAWMKVAGTATNYTGLYASVAAFRPPTAAELKSVPADFSPRVKISPMVDAMVEIDNRFDNLKLVRKAGYKSPPSHLDISPAHEALLLEELLRELRRSPDTLKRKPDFLKQLTDSEAAARELRGALNQSPLDAAKADLALQKVTDSCAACHKAHRN
jgi:protein tyrosine phosphatase (PTP) superfamily phosphohydrolase (DUF442 family)